MTCQICETRRPRRFCPGVNGEICSVCCGTEREVTVNCPLECEYLQEARLHEKLPELTPEDIPNSDIRVTEQFLDENNMLVTYLSAALLRAVLSTSGAVDNDVREALDALIRTYRTRESGLYYETRPANLLAAGIQQRLQQGIEEFTKQVAEQSGISTIRDSSVLGSLVFLQRIERHWNNGRPRGRSYIDSLRRHFAGLPATAQEEAQEEGSRLIVP